MRSTIAILILALFSLAACGGEGYKLDEYGNPIGTTPDVVPMAFEPTFGNIQNKVFNRSCAECHTGASASLALRLDAENSYRLLVNRKSSQSNDLLLVKPWDPDSSYLIRKLEGRPGVIGSQMPLYRPVLPQQEINSIREWIKRGAENN